LANELRYLRVLVVLLLLQIFIFIDLALYFLKGDDLHLHSIPFHYFLGLQMFTCPAFV